MKIENDSFSHEHGATEEMTDADSFIDSYWKYVEICINEEGIFPYPSFVQEEFKDGKIGTTYNSITLNPEQTVEIHIKARYRSNPAKRIIFGFDRTTKPDQDTEFDDVFTLWFWETGMEHWRTGVINYKPMPDKIIRPIDWDNKFWNKQLFKEIMDFE